MLWGDPYWALRREHPVGEGDMLINNKKYTDLIQEKQRKKTLNQYGKYWIWVSGCFIIAGNNHQRNKWEMVDIQNRFKNANEGFYATLHWLDK